MKENMKKKMKLNVKMASIYHHLILVRNALIPVQNVYPKLIVQIASMVSKSKAENANASTCTKVAKALHVTNPGVTAVLNHTNH